MGNGTNAFDFGASLSTFLGSPVSDGTWSDVVVTLKADSIDQTAKATDIANAGGQLWSNLVDDFIRATYPSFHLAAKVWRVATETALVGLGSDNALAVDDIGYTENEHRLWYCTSVTAATSSKWVPLPVRVPFSWDQVASQAFATASEDDYIPPSPWPNVHVLRMKPNAGGTSITGIEAGDAGQVVRVCNIDSADNLTLMHEDVGSDVPNRILNSNNSDAVIRPNACLSLWYDETSVRWRTG